MTDRRMDKWQCFVSTGLVNPTDPVQLAQVAHNLTNHSK